ncbi:MAG: triose-phosphate isomerase [bacterium]|nr:triose-phosphate isomerase [bacterium]
MLKKGKFSSGKMGKKIIVGNWKMNPSDIGKAKEIFVAVKKFAVKLNKIEITVCPPFTFINSLKKMDLAGNVRLGGQNVFSEKYGAYTGEVSILELQSVGADTVIVGHSERRAMGETEEQISKKVFVGREEGFRVILCVGEKTRDDEGSHFGFLEEQIKNSLAKVPKRFLKDVIVAYEPIWAIGKSSKFAIDKSGLEETVLFIRKVINGIYDSESAHGIKVLYGGSVSDKNAAELMSSGIAGFLVGHESLMPSHFKEIAKIMETA